MVKPGRIRRPSGGKGRADAKSPSDPAASALRRSPGRSSTVSVAALQRPLVVLASLDHCLPRHDLLNSRVRGGRQVA